MGSVIDDSSGDELIASAFRYVHRFLRLDHRSLKDSDQWTRYNEPSSHAICSCHRRSPVGCLCCLDVYSMNQPWLTMIDCPVSAFDSKAARNSAVSATSATVVN